jgi:hypothetical protein
MSHKPSHQTENIPAPHNQRVAYLIPERFNAHVKSSFEEPCFGQLQLVSATVL